jgi:hypothetical protein
MMRVHIAVGVRVCNSKRNPTLIRRVLVAEFEIVDTHKCATFAIINDFHPMAWKGGFDFSDCDFNLRVHDSPLRIVVRGNAPKLITSPQDNMFVVTNCRAEAALGFQTIQDTTDVDWDTLFDGGLFYFQARHTPFGESHKMRNVYSDRDGFDVNAEDRAIRMVNFHPRQQFLVIRRFEVSQDFGVVRKVKKAAQAFDGLLGLQRDFPYVVGHEGKFWGSTFRDVTANFVEFVGESEHIASSEVNVCIVLNDGINWFVVITDQSALRFSCLSQNVTGLQSPAGHRKKTIANDGCPFWGEQICTVRLVLNGRFMYHF